jgi:hypothetical protein
MIKKRLTPCCAGSAQRKVPPHPVGTGLPGDEAEVWCNRRRRVDQDKLRL